MSCIICGSPYVTTTDNRCHKCIGKPLVYEYPVTVQIYDKMQRMTDRELEKRERAMEERFYKKVFED